MFLNNHNHKGSFRFFFPKRSKRARDRVIGDYLAAQKTLWHAWGNRTFEEFLSTAGAATPNSIQILLAVGAAELSPALFVTFAGALLIMLKSWMRLIILSCPLGSTLIRFGPCSKMKICSLFCVIAKNINYASRRFTTPLLKLHFFFYVIQLPKADPAD